MTIPAPLVPRVPLKAVQARRYTSDRKIKERRMSMKWSAWRGWLVALMMIGGTVAAQPLEWPPVGEPSNAARTAGRWLWADLVTTDLARSREFYSKVFGWDFRAVPGEDGQPAYLTIVAGGRPIGGMVALRKDAASTGARWIGLASGDPKTMAARAQERGGGVVMPPRQLPGRGEVTVLSDPDGVRFAVIRSDGGDPADHRGRVNEWLWAEFWTADPGRAANFYRDVFGYSVGAADGKATGFQLSAGGRARAGVLRSPDTELPAAWIPYVRVDDVAATVARARAAGGRVVVEPRAHYRSQVAVLVDPLGAPFAVANWRTQ
jgi:predicted enzyme related to lactoylglutathione lyase